MNGNQIIALCIGLSAWVMPTILICIVQDINYTWIYIVSMITTLICAILAD